MMHLKAFVSFDGNKGKIQSADMQDFFKRINKDWKSVFVMFP